MRDYIEYETIINVRYFSFKVKKKAYNYINLIHDFHLLFQTKKKKGNQVRILFLRIKLCRKT